MRHLPDTLRSQRSISDFFSKKEGPSSVPATPSSLGARSPLRKTPAVSTSPGSALCPEPIPCVDLVDDNDSPNVDSRAPVQTPTRRPRSEQHRPGPEKAPSSQPTVKPRAARRLEFPDSVAVADASLPQGPSDCDSDGDFPMTQEEEEVNEQLKALECSQDAEYKEDDVVSSLYASPHEQRVKIPASGTDTKSVAIEHNSMSESADGVQSSPGKEAAAISLDKDGDTEMGGFDRDVDGTSVGQNSTHVASYHRRPITAKASPDPLDSDDETPPRPSDRAGRNDDESGTDSEDERLLVDSGHASAAQVPRRSSRIASTVPRSDPFSSLGNRNASASRSVFGGSVFGGKGGGVSQAARAPGHATSLRAMKAMLRDRNQRDESKRLVEDARHNAEHAADPSTAGDNVEIYASFAAAEERKAAEQHALLDKYQMQVGLFVAEPKERRPPHLDEQTMYGMFESGNVIHVLHDLLIQAIVPTGSTGEDLSTGANFALAAMLGPINEICKEGHPPPPGSFDFVVKAIFELCVFDDTDEIPGTLSRDDLLCGLQNLTRTFGTAISGAFPSLSSVLRNFGAVFDLASGAKSTESSPGAKCLDNHVFLSREDDQEAAKAVRRSQRNLRRAFALFTSAVNSGAPLESVLEEQVGASHPGRRSALSAVNICARVMLSPFGVHLSREVGMFLSAVLEHIDSENWPQFRLDAAKSIIGITNRLGLHAELVSYLMPHRSIRARHLCLDVAFLSLTQWHGGPAECPKPADVQQCTPSETALKKGVHNISYTLADILHVLTKIPEMDRYTDVVWACGLACVLKQAVVDLDVLATKEQGEVGSVISFLSKIRKSSMVVDVRVQNMRLALDATLKSLESLAGNSKQIRAEVHPFARVEKMQANIATMFPPKVSSS